MGVGCSEFHCIRLCCACCLGGGGEKQGQDRECEGEEDRGQIHGKSELSYFMFFVTLLLRNAIVGDNVNGRWVF